MKVKIFIAAIPFAFFACSTPHYYYMQTSHQVPLFKEKNEVRVTVATGGGAASGKEIQAAYSITNKLSLMGAWMKLDGGSNSLNGLVNGWHGQYTEGALGYFKDYKKYGVFEIYAGAGSGIQTHSYFTDSSYWVPNFFGIPIIETKTIDGGKANLVHSKFYLQPSYGLSYKIVDIALSCRFSDLFYNSIDNHVTINSDAEKEMQKIYHNRNNFIIEPALIGRIGWKYLKFQLQWAYSVMLGSDIPIDNTHITVGLNFALAKRFWRKEESK